jgi:hypothetical protein
MDSELMADGGFVIDGVKVKRLRVIADEGQRTNDQ